MARLGTVSNFCPYALCLHQTSNTMAAATFTGLTKFPGDLAVAVHRSACQPRVLDKAAQTIILTTTRPARIARPCVVATAVNPKHSTHGRQPELAQVLTHESVLRRHPLAKYAAAFFRFFAHLRGTQKRALTLFGAAVGGSGAGPPCPFRRMSPGVGLRPPPPPLFRLQGHGGPAPDPPTSAKKAGFPLLTASRAP